jgi:hypothetical protein
MRQPVEAGRRFGGFCDDRRVQATADGLGDIPDRYALLGDGVISRTASSKAINGGFELLEAKCNRCDRVSLVPLASRRMALTHRLAASPFERPRKRGSSG